MRPYLLFLLAILALIVSGCGGGGGGGSSTAKNATIGIDWPNRTRAITTDLTSAQSATIVIVKGSAHKEDITFTVNRDAANLAAHTEDYPIPVPVRKDSATVSIQFFSAPDAGGTLVGTATCAVSFTEGSLEPTHVTLAGEANAIAIVDPGNLVIGSAATQLTATVTTHDGTVLAVSPGSIQWVVNSGSGYVSVTQDGLATALAVGAASVTAKIDGLSSPTASIHAIEPGPVTQVLPIGVSNLTYNAATGKLWAAVGDDGSTYANSIVSIDPQTGTIGTPISVGGTPQFISVTDDGQYAFVTIYVGHVVRRIKLSDGTVGPTVLTATGDAYSDLKAVPGTTNSFAVAVDPTFGVNATVYDDGVQRTGTGAVGYTMQFNTNDPTTLYGDGHGSLFTCLLTSTSINWTDQTGITVTGFKFCKTDSQLYTASGQIIDPVTKTSTGVLSSANFNSDRDVALDETDDRVYFVTWGSSKKILTFNRTTKTELTMYDTGVTRGGATNLTACGNHTVAFHLYGDGQQTVVLVKNLP